MMVVVVGPALAMRVVLVLMVAAGRRGLRLQLDAALQVERADGQDARQVDSSAARGGRPRTD